jgi:hypothetical protein
MDAPSRLGPFPREKPRLVVAGLSLGRLSAAGILIGLGLWLHGLVGLLLLVAGTDLAVSRRCFAPRSPCWPALGFTAAGMLLVDPALAFACGWLVELGCDPALAAVPASSGPEGHEGED